MRGWPKVPADLVPRLCKLTDGNPLFLEEMLGSLQRARGRARGRNRSGRHAGARGPRAIGGDPRARRSTCVAAARGGHLPPAGRCGCRTGVRSEHRGRGSGVDARTNSSTRSTVRRSRACSAAWGVWSATAMPSPMAWCAMRSTASCSAVGGCATTTRSPLSTERVHGESVDRYVNELAHHFYMGSALADADKAIRYCISGRRTGSAPPRFRRGGRPPHAGARSGGAVRWRKPAGALRRTDCARRGAEPRGRRGPRPMPTSPVPRLSLGRSGIQNGSPNTALRAGPLSYLGVVDAHEEQIELLEEALVALPREDSHLRARVTGQLGLVIDLVGGSAGTGSSRTGAGVERGGGRYGAASRRPSRTRLRTS